MKRGEWKVDVNIGFWKCWAIFRADTKSISWSSRNEMICPFWWLAAAGINVHFEFWWSFSTITDYLWLKNWRERKTLPTLFSLGNLGSSEINFVAKCVNSLQLWSFDRKLNIERLHKDSPDLHFTQLQLIMKKHLDLSTWKKIPHSNYTYGALPSLVKAY